MKGMKWMAFGRAYVEGDEVFFSFLFEIPEDLYKDLCSFSYENKFITAFSRYEELVNYAKISVDYRKYSGFYDENCFPEASEKENIKYIDDYETILFNVVDTLNGQTDRVDAALEYIRILDPCAQKIFEERCFDLPVEEKHKGHQREFHYISDGEDCTWRISYNSEGEIDGISKIDIWAYGKYGNKYLGFDGTADTSLYPPYENIVKKLDEKDIYEKIID